MFWNLENVASMKYTFTSCTGLTELDMTGLDPAGLTDLGSAFSGCANLRKIVVDASWALPTGVTGVQTFYGCTSLVGGNGTTYDASRTGCQYMRVDAQGAPGYLTGE